MLWALTADEEGSGETWLDRPACRWSQTTKKDPDGSWVYSLYVYVPRYTTKADSDGKLLLSQHRARAHRTVPPGNSAVWTPSGPSWSRVSTSPPQSVSAERVEFVVGVERLLPVRRRLPGPPVLPACGCFCSTFTLFDLRLNCVACSSEPPSLQIDPSRCPGSLARPLALSLSLFLFFCRDVWQDKS